MRNANDDAIQLGDLDRIASLRYGGRVVSLAAATACLNQRRLVLVT
jgi:hypothetical protein